MEVFESRLKIARSATWNKGLVMSSRRTGESREFLDAGARATLRNWPPGGVDRRARGGCLSSRSKNPTEQCYQPAPNSHGRWWRVASRGRRLRGNLSLTFSFPIVNFSPFVGAQPPRPRYGGAATVALYDATRY